MSVTIREGSAIDVLRTLPSESVQCVVTSPPYFQLRDYGVDGQIGMESTPSAFIAALLDVFDEVGRVMRPDATLWVNLGDSYAGSGKGPPARDGSSIPSGIHSHAAGPTKVGGLPAKNLLLVPERFAIGMQDRGWICRSQIVWSKASCMPESVRDRCTSAWEPIWMFAKSARYYWDAESVRLKDTPGNHGGGYLGPRDHLTGLDRNGTSQDGLGKMVRGETGANLRNVWHLGPSPFKDAHFATFPPEIPKRCILAGTSEKGACPACGAPWVRQSQPSEKYATILASNAGRNNVLPGRDDLNIGQRGQARTTNPRIRAERVTTGWDPSCSCPPAEPRPCVVLDPFLGSGTTALVADRLGRDAIGIELNPTYARMARDRIANDAPMVSEPVEVVAGDQLGLFEAVS